jgi:hypothetical protein
VLGEPADQGRGDGRLDQVAAGVQRADGVAQLVHHELLVVEGGQHEHRRPGYRLVRQRAQHADTVQPRHPQVQQQDVDLGGLDHLERLDAVARLGHHGELGTDLQQAAKTLPHKGLIVDHADPDHVGSLAASRNPHSGAVSYRSSPPSCSIRSRMPVIVDVQVHLGLGDPGHRTE